MVIVIYSPKYTSQYRKSGYNTNYIWLSPSAVIQNDNFINIDNARYVTKCLSKNYNILVGFYSMHRFLKFWKETSVFVVRRVNTLILHISFWGKIFKNPDIVSYSAKWD